MVTNKILYYFGMSVELQALEDAVRDFKRDADLDFVDAKRLAAVIDGLQGTLSTVLFQGKRRGDHLLTGKTPCGSVMHLTPGAAAERLRVGEQLEAMPQIAQALSSGEIGYQSTAVICNFRSKLREDLRQNIDQGFWIEQARESSVRDLSWLEQNVRYLVDPDSFDHQVEEDWEKRFLSISESGGMFHISGVLDRVGGAAPEAAIESLSKRAGTADGRTPKQRRADALVEVVNQAMDKGTLPRRNGVRPHISVSTTIQGLKGELGAAASQLGNGMPISSKTVQRLACDGTLHRILKADSAVVDVGWATRSVSPSQWRALKARHRTCSGPGCDRPVSMTSPHHIEFWARGGRSDLPNLLPLCYYHHRLVHEGDWQVIRTGGGVRFVAPERVFLRRRRWGERRAA